MLEVCEPENISHVVAAEQQLTEVNDEFDEDLDLIAGSNSKKDSSEESENHSSDDESEMSEDDDLEEENDESSEEEEDSESPKRKKQQLSKANKKQKTPTDDEMSEDDFVNESADEEEKTDETWTDIYGRLRRKDGTIIEEESEKYIPPAVRAAIQSDDKKTTEKLLRLKKQLKGFINRLAESNMHSISTQIENLYMNNSRNNMNETLTNLLLDSLLSSVLTPERLLVEHVMLIAILHANVGTEVGKLGENFEQKPIINCVLI